MTFNWEVVVGKRNQRLCFFCTFFHIEINRICPLASNPVFPKSTVTMFKLIFSFTFFLFYALQMVILCFVPN